MEANDSLKSHGVPKLEYRVSIVNTTDPSDCSYTSGLLQSGTTEYTFNGVSKGRTYTVTVTAINGVGSNSTVGNITAPRPFSTVMTATTSKTDLMTATTSSSTTVVQLLEESSITCTTNTYNFPSTTDQLSSSAVAGISVSITVPITAVITTIITGIVMYLCWGSVSGRHSNKQNWSPREYETPVISGTNEVELKSNTAYGQVKYTKDTSEVPTIVYDSVDLHPY